MPGLLAHYTFDEPSGPVIDGSGNGRDVSTDVPRGEGHESSGSSGPEMILMGPPSGVAAYTSQIRSMTLWAYLPTGFGVVPGVILGVGPEVGFLYWQMSFGFAVHPITGDLRAFVTPDGDEQVDLHLELADGFGGWHFIALSWDADGSGDVTAWFDGVESDEKYVLGSPAATAGDIMQADPVGDGYRVDSLRIYDQPIDEQQVLDDMGTGITLVRNIRVGSVLPNEQAVGDSRVEVFVGPDMAWGSSV